MDSLTNIFPILINGLRSGAYDMAGVLRPAGLNLLGILTVGMVAWTGIKTMLTDGGLSKFLADAITLLFTCSLASWFLTSADGYHYLTASVVNTFDCAATMISNKTPTCGSSTWGGGGTNGGGVYAGAANLMTGLQQIWSSFQFSAPASTSMFDIVTHGFSMAIVMIEDFVLFLIAVVFLGAAIVVYVLQYVVSNVLLAIALAVGPMFIPWIMLDATKSVFEGWLRFLVTAGVYQIVAAVMIGLVSPMTATVLKLVSDYMATPASNELGSGTGVVAVNSLGIILIAAVSFIIAYLLWHVPAIANGLMSGGVSVGMSNPMAATRVKWNVGKLGGKAPPPPKP